MSVARAWFEWSWFLGGFLGFGLGWVGLGVFCGLWLFVWVVRVDSVVWVWFGGLSVIWV